jgi:lysophospholipase L1-like esterase
MTRIISATSYAARVTLICIAVSIELSGCGGGPTGPGGSALQISCPSAIERESPLDQPITVVFSPTTAGGASPVTTTCQPASGGEFALGRTTVQCTARDAESRTSACSFDVVVKGAPKLSLTRFIAFGDSLTEGTTAPNAFLTLVVASQSYPFKLETLLKDRYRSQDVTVGNDGVAGEEALEAAQRRFRSMLRVHNPEAVLLMEGSNDLFFFREEAFELALPALEEMVTDGQEAGAKMFLATIPPQRPNGLRNRAAVAALIPDFNKEIRAIAQRTGATLVDIEPVILANMSLIGDDDLHPTEQGYQVIAETFFKVIKDTLEVPSAPAIR